MRCSILIFLVAIGIVEMATTRAPKTPNATIAIIGAGFAGLRAARHFEELKMNYIVLEGSNRVGGRVYPFEYGTGYLQYGAEYVNGVNNEIYEIAMKNNLLSLEELDDETYETVVNGKELEESLEEMWYKFEEKTNQKIEKEASNRKLNNQSISERIDEHYQQFLAANTFLPKDMIILNAMKDLFKNQYQLEWSAKADDMCLKNLDVWDSGVDKEWTLNEFGFKTILDKFTVGVPKEKIRLNAKVVNIRYSSDSPVQIELSNSQILSFDSVIVTSSLGYLKKHKATMFNPPLSMQKSLAIDQLGYGSNMKIFLEYDRPWWTSGMGGLQIAGNTTTKDFMLFNPSLWAENVLVAWVAGNGPSVVANLTDDQLMVLITNHLTTNLKGVYTVPKIKKLYRHNWISDEFALGSYTYISKTACSGDLTEQIASPVSLAVRGVMRPVICFAGEHTDSTMYQTVVGAAKSGLREATRLYKYYSTL